ncbi:hypothetical protein H5410_004616 [Solanum commersonii]|uniref:Non-specific serine/threonine protein kinase n=1 Tax=Solanum commersonii TaxID=4109 RepID=A0A9J6B8H3_SOLCO|nr:hypothetical protein H5410_004616 [Solanum commersonii]
MELPISYSLILGTHKIATSTPQQTGLEYGQNGIVSTSCDVYCFCIVIMETFTGRKPSDEIFKGEMNVRCKVAVFVIYHEIRFELHCSDS